MEFVGPLEKVLIGSCAAALAGRIVPSFWVTKTGQFRSRTRMAFSKARMVVRAKGRMEAFSIAAFSLSTNPRLATAHVVC